MRILPNDAFVEWSASGFNLGRFELRRPWWGFGRPRLRGVVLWAVDVEHGDASYYWSQAFLAGVVRLMDANAGAVHAFFRGHGPSQRFRPDDEWGRISVTVDELLAAGDSPMPRLDDRGRELVQ